MRVVAEAEVFVRNVDSDTGDKVGTEAGRYSVRLKGPLAPADLSSLAELIASSAEKLARVEL